MKLLIFIHSLSSGGAERVTSNLANYWAEKGWDVSIVTITGRELDFYQLHPAIHRVALSLDKDSTNLFESIKNNYPNRNYFVMSRLGSQAEIQYVELFMQKLGAKLLVPLPLPYQLYQDDLRTGGIDESFRRLIGKSVCYYEMPLRFGTLQTLHPNAKARGQQYEYTENHIRECSNCIF